MGRKATSGPDAYFLNLPLTPYEEALDLQRAAVTARADGRLSADLVILVEHPPVFTLGRRGGLDNLTVEKQFLEEKGIQLQPVERGGNITYHGPGQLVVYPVMHIKAARIGVADYVAALETAMVRTAAKWGIDADGDPGNRGTWVRGRKLGSIGITIRRGIAFHGLALNVNNDMQPFGWINPCGLKNCTMTSIAREVGRPVSMQTARERMKQHLADLLRFTGRVVDAAFIKRRLRVPAL